MFSFILLFFLDPYVPTNGKRANQKSGDPPAEQLQILTELIAEPGWRDFERPRVPLSANIIRKFRKTGAGGMISQKYAVMEPGLRLTDSIAVMVEGEKNATSIFDTVYTTDADSRRTTTGPKKIAKNTFVFLGCSFTWGSGVADHETFSSVINRGVLSSNVLNLGIRGAGPHDMIDDLIENPQRLNGMVKGEGIAVYTLIGDHIERALCQSSCYIDEEKLTKFNSGYPLKPERTSKTRYILKNGTLVNDGPFSNENSLAQAAKKLFFKSRLLTHLYFDWNSRWSQEELFQFAKIVERLKNEIQSRTGYEFYLAFFPDNEIEQDEELMVILDELGIRYLEYSKLKFNITQKWNSVHQFDGHPTKLGHEAYARLLIHDLKRRSPKQFENR